MPSEDLVRKRQARALMRKRGASYADALRATSRTTSQQSPAETPVVSGPSVWIGPETVMTEMLPSCARMKASRTLVVCPARAMVAVEQALGMGEEPVVSIRTHRMPELPAEGMVILSQSILSATNSQAVKSLLRWKPEVLVLPFAQDLVTPSKRQRSVICLARVSARVLAGVDYFGAFRPTQVGTLIRLTGHGKTLFQGRFTSTYLKPFAAYGRTILGWDFERTDELQSLLSTHVLVNEPEEWPWNAARRQAVTS